MSAATGFTERIAALEIKTDTLEENLPDEDNGSHTEQDIQRLVNEAVASSHSQLNQQISTYVTQSVNSLVAQKLASLQPSSAPAAGGAAQPLSLPNSAILKRLENLEAALFGTGTDGAVDPRTPLFPNTQTAPAPTNASFTPPP